MWRGSKNWGWGERDYEGMIDEMKIFYQEMLFPLEEKYKYHSFHSPALNDADFGAKPLVMLVGQYSTGKTSFIRYLLGQVIFSLDLLMIQNYNPLHCIAQDFPGLDIGKSPTTRKFIVVGHGEDKAEIFGRVLLNDPTTQFRTLQQYGTAFANMFQLSTTNSEVLGTFTHFPIHSLLTHSF